MRGNITQPEKWIYAVLNIPPHFPLSSGPLVYTSQSSATLATY